jgi:hypothetical protein
MYLINLLLNIDVKYIANKKSFLSNIFIIVGGKNEVFVPTHRSNCRVGKGNKEYLNLGLGHEERYISRKQTILNEIFYFVMLKSHTDPP